LLELIMKIIITKRVFSLFILIILLPVCLYYFWLEMGSIIPTLKFVKNEPIEDVAIISEETQCDKDDDCIITSYTYECCGSPCSGELINKTSFESRKQWTLDNCNSESYDKCGFANCEYVKEKAVCKNHNCIRKKI